MTPDQRPRTPAEERLMAAADEITDKLGRVLLLLLNRTAQHHPKTFTTTHPETRKALQANLDLVKRLNLEDELDESVPQSFVDKE